MIRCCHRFIGQEFNIMSRLQNTCYSWKTQTFLFPKQLSLTVTNLQCFNNVSFSSNPPNNTTEDFHLNSQAASIFNNMKDFGIEKRELVTTLKNQPVLLKISPNLWNISVQMLVSHGFQNNEILAIIEKCPNVLLLKESEITNNLLAWLGAELGNDLVCELIISHPHFLLVKPSVISKRVKQYQLMFESKKRIGKLLLLAPNLLEENWSTVLEKINYLDDLCVDKSEMASSGVLAHSLFHIKARHEFLIRSGLYKKPQKDFHKKLSKNPKLKSIVNPSDDQFVSAAQMTILEYNVFLEMFEEELKNLESDSDSDTDEEN